MRTVTAPFVLLTINMTVGYDRRLLLSDGDDLESWITRMMAPLRKGIFPDRIWYRDFEDGVWAHVAYVPGMHVGLRTYTAGSLVDIILDTAGSVYPAVFYSDLIRLRIDDVDLRYTDDRILFYLENGIYDLSILMPYIEWEGRYEETENSLENTSKATEIEDPTGSED